MRRRLGVESAAPLPASRSFHAAGAHTHRPHGPLEAVEVTLKQLLATPGEQIQLDDFVSRHVRASLEATSLESFPVQGVNVNASATSG